MRPDERLKLGCIYIVPSHKQGFDAAAALWVRASEVAGDLDHGLYATVRRWLADRWPFSRVAWPGRSCHGATTTRCLTNNRQVGRMLAEPARHASFVKSCTYRQP
jgi:hypothetical protein